MSDILQKSLASLPALLTGSALVADNTGVSAGLVNFTKHLSNLTSKLNEKHLVERELSHLKKRLALPTLTTAQSRDCLLRLVHCHMLGYDVSFAYIQAVKLAQQGSILEKRVGYLTCALFLSDSHELTMLLINTIHRDMNSTNILQLCTAMVAACYLVSAEMVPLVLPAVVEKLKHQKEIVRRKAVLCLHSFVCKVPDIARQIHGFIYAILGDKDPGVVWAVVEVYRQLVKIDPSLCQDVVLPIIDILSQVTNRRLPTLFDYHSVPSPWFTISLLKLLASLIAGNPNAAQSSRPVLNELLLRTEPSHMAGLAVIYEALLTISSIPSEPSLMTLATKCIGRFLSSKNVNLVYIGVKILSRVVCIDAGYALQHQGPVMQCLNHADQTVQEKTLELLSNMANSVNKEAICNCLIERLSLTTDNQLKLNIVSRVTRIIHRLADNTRWYIDKTSDLLRLQGSLAPPDCIQQLITVIQHGLESSCELSNETERHGYAVEYYWRLLESQEPVDESLVCVAVWTLGEYGSLMQNISVDDIFRYLCRCYGNCAHDTTKLWILSALIKLLPKASTSPELVETLTKSSSSTNQEIIQRVHELKILSSSSSAQQLLHASNRLSLYDMDFSLSFLDNYVSTALEAGALPYRTANLRQLATMQPSNDEVGSRSKSTATNSSVAISSERFGEDLSAAAESFSSLFVPYVFNSIQSISKASSQSNIAASLLTSPESKSSADSEHSGQKLVPTGVKQIWSKDGIVGDTGYTSMETIPVSEHCVEPFTEQILPLPEKMEEKHEHDNLAAALFSGIEPVSSVSVLQTPDKVSRVPDNYGDVTATADHERSISPDSIDQNDDGEDNETTVSSFRGFRSSPDSDLAESFNSVSVGHIGSLRSSSHNNRPSILTSRDSDDRIHSGVLLVENTHSGVSALQNNQTGVSPSENTHSCVLALQNNQIGVIPVQNTDSGVSSVSNTTSAVLALQNNHTVSLLVAGNTDNLMSSSLPDSSVNALELFRCSVVTLSMKKYIADDSLDIVFHIQRQCEAEHSSLDDASISFDAADCLAITTEEESSYVDASKEELLFKTSLDNSAYERMVRVRLTSATVLDQCEPINSLLVKFSVPTINLHSTPILIKLSPVDFLSVSSANAAYRKKEIVLTDALIKQKMFMTLCGPSRLTVEEFSKEWSASKIELKVMLEVETQEISSVLEFLTMHCRMCSIQTKDCESILSSHLLTHTPGYVLLHCCLTTPQSANSKLTLWAKSFCKTFLSTLFNEVSTHLGIVS